MRRPPLVVRRAAVHENGRLAVEHRAQIVRHPPPERVLFHIHNESLITLCPIGAIIERPIFRPTHLVLDAEHERGSRHGEHYLLDVSLLFRLAHYDRIYQRDGTDGNAGRLPVVFLGCLMPGGTDISN